MKDYDKKYSINVTQYKILVTVSELNKKSLYPSLKGLRNILSGSDDKETVKYRDISTYSSLISVQKRTLASIVLMLVRSEFLTYKYDPKSDDMYLMITIKGNESIYDFKKHHKVSLISKEKTLRDEIVRIE